VRPAAVSYVPMIKNSGLMAEGDGFSRFMAKNKSIAKGASVRHRRVQGHERKPLF